MPTVSLDIDAIMALANLPLHVMMWRLFIGGGWVPAVVTLIWGAKHYWLLLREEMYQDTREFHIFALDIPKENEQSPRAVENMFSHLTGTRSTNTFKETWWEGKAPPVFSFEIVSLGGYIQFLVRTEKKYYDLVQALVYAQYPDAEITEVEDYTRGPGVPKKFPDPTFNMYGTEFTMSDKPWYPIRTYEEFEHKLSQEFKDPLATLLEGMARIRPDEQIWFQMTIWGKKPKEWVPQAQRLVKKLIGGKTHHKEGILSKLGTIPMSATESLFKYTIHAGQEEEKKRVKTKEEEAFSSQILYLSPGEGDIVKAVDKKMTKPGFDVKIRFLYFGPKKSFRTGAIISVVRGYLGQFALVSSNYLGFAGKVSTRMDYFWQKRKILSYLTLGLYKSLVYRQNRILASARRRHPHWGWQPMVMNSEELATIWHFPVVQVKAPSIKKIESRRGEAPFKLPVESGTVMPRSIASAMPPKGQRPFEIPMEDEKPDYSQ